MERGKYIVIEGGDGTGKSTQAEILVNKLQKTGRLAKLVEEPGSTLIGKEIRKIVKDGNLDRTPLTNLLLFTASRIELWNQVIKPSIDSGQWVVSARNWYSTLAYQGYGEGLDYDLIQGFTTEYVSPDYATPDCSMVLVHSDYDEINQRITRRLPDTKNDYFEESNNISKYTVDKSYKEIAHRVGCHIIKIDSMDIDQVHGRIWKIVEKYLME